MVAWSKWCGMEKPFREYYIMGVTTQKMTHPARRDGDEMGVSFNSSSLLFETATEISLSYAYSRQQPTLVKC